MHNATNWQIALLKIEKTDIFWYVASITEHQASLQKGNFLTE